MLTKNSSFLLTKDDFEQADHLPDWLLREYKTFSETVTDPTFPCFFGMTAQRRGELRYSYIEHDKWDHLPEAVESFLSLFTPENKTRHGLFIFVEPESEEKSIDYYRSYFWDILQYLHEQDRFDWPGWARRKTLNIIYGISILQASQYSRSVMRQLINKEKLETLATVSS